MPITSIGWQQGIEGDVLTMVSGVPRWQTISPPTLDLSQNALWIGDATDHASELPAGTNGQVLKINALGVPSWSTVNLLPSGTAANTTLVWDGTQWIENTNVTMDPATGNIMVRGNLTVNGTEVNLPAGSIDNNELANSSVNVSYGAGVSGDASVALGGTLNLQNTGVTSATGTANQVNVSSSTGDITVSLPQDIDQNATPTFDGAVLDNLSNGSTATEIVVSNGGGLETRDLNSIVGSTTLNENSLWVGNASNNPSELGAGTSGQILQINGGGSPVWTDVNELPTGTTNNSTLVWNGTEWVENSNVTLNPVSGDIITSGSETIGGNSTVTGDLTVNGTDVTLPAGSIDNSELANDDVNVTYGTGLSGDASVVLGGTLNLQNTGVTSATGTANQVNVSSSTGGVTFSLPQDIDQNATPTFDGAVLDNLSNGSTATEIVVSNGGGLETRDLNSIVGSTTLNENSLWVGNALNNPSELGAGTNGQVLRINGTTPTWETLNILPTGTTTDATLVWNGTSWVENSNVTLNPVSGDITTTGDVNAVEVTTTGNTTVGGDLSVAGPNVNLPGRFESITVS